MIRIEKVLSKREFKEFIAFPSQLFRDDPNWIEPLHVEREEHLSKKNPGTDHIEWQAWVTKKQGKVVGRITAQIDALHRELHGEDTGHFGMIDAVDDPAVFSTLFTAAEEWLRSKGARKITGPFSLNINQESGLLVEGFDTPPSALMTHAKPYYAAQIAQQGYSEGIDLLAYWMKRTDLHFSPSLTRMMDQVRKKVTVRRLNRKRFREEMQVLREVFNSGWQHNWGFVPFTEHEFATMGDQLKFAGARRYDPYRRGGWRPLRLYRRSAEHQRSDCRSAGAVIAVRLGEALVAAESQRRAHRARAVDGRAPGISIQPHRADYCAAAN